MRYLKITQSQIETRIASIYSTAKHCKYDANYIHNAFKELTTELRSVTASGKPRYPYYMVKFAQGYNNALHDNLWQNELEFCYVYNDELYSTHKVSTHKNAELLYLNRENSSDFMDSLERGHYWKGTSKKFA